MNQDNFDNTRSFGAIHPGAEIAQYTIVERIGAGGMGEVYLADDTHLRRQVALKFLSLDLAGNEDFRKRFLREARAAAALNHASIVTMYDVSEFKGRPYIAMEYIQGESLKKSVREGTLNAGQILNVAFQLASGLEAAHQAGIVHRDIKSENIILDARGNAHILDFGLAKVQRDQDHTQTGTTLGTVSYMSPEQAEGKQVDARSDLFSLGVVLFELISGKLPFTGEHIGAVINAILNLEPASIDEKKTASLPNGVLELVSRLLQKNPDNRYQNAAELLADLRNYASNTAILRVGTHRTKLSLWAYLLPSLAVMTVAILYYIIQPFDRDISTDDITMIAVLPFENLGSEDDRYFALGITDEINTQLSKLTGLGVISRSSVTKYEARERDLPKIGNELGVTYVLEGRILWDKSVDPVRVKISAVLSSTNDGIELWADSYDKVLKDIFAVQADIAKKVSKSLNVRLAVAEVESLEDTPTENLEAFTYYLQGNDYFNRNDWAIAIEMYLHATALDPNFAVAFANMSRAHSLMFWHYLDRSSERLELARKTAKRALTLDPNLPEAHLAMGRYHYRANLDYDQALLEFKKALTVQPGNSDLLFAVGSVKRRQGLWNKATSYFERATRLDPRSWSKLSNLGDTYALIRDFRKAQTIFEQLRSLAPDNAIPYSKLFTLQLRWDGDVNKARAILDESPNHLKDQLIDDRVTFDLISGNYDQAIERLSVLRHREAYLQDSSYFFIRMGELLQAAGKDKLAYEYFDTSRVILEVLAGARPDEPQYHSLLAVAYAGSGNAEAAIKEGYKSVELCPIAEDALSGTNWLYNLVVTLVMAGEYELALTELTILLDKPSVATIPFLRTNPVFDDFLKNPEIEAALAGH